VYFAAADDMVDPRFFELAMTAVRRWPHVAVVSGALAFIDTDDHWLGMERGALPSYRMSCISPARAARLIVRFDNWISGSAAIYRTSALRGIGGFPAQLQGLADSFAARILALKDGAVFIPHVLAYWRRTDVGFAAQTISRPDRAAAVERAAEALVATEFQALFPVPFMKRFRRRWTYWQRSQMIRQKSGMWSAVLLIACFLR
ncbi:MAG: hypothetical protein RLN70_08475, partial [Rhodospirillaceae bacterium]